jgi:hypothetical protein
MLLVSQVKSFEASAHILPILALVSLLIVAASGMQAFTAPPERDFFVLDFSAVQPAVIWNDFGLDDDKSPAR